MPSAASDSKRSEGVLSWDDFFIFTASLAAKRSKDPSTQVGACIVDADNRILSIGYNGFPRGCSDDVRAAGWLFSHTHARARRLPR